MSDREPRNVTSVGGLVVRGDAVLLVRMTYGPNRGRYMLPGGLIDPGETLDVAIAREVREEAGVEARPVGIIGLRSRFDGPDNDTYVLWLLEHVAGEPRAEGRENDDARFFTLAEIEARDDIADLVRYLARRVLRGEIRPHRLVDDYHSRLPGTTPDSWKLFM
ncbi:NUDIX domain-containing protein [Sphaerobacter sp.]|uniref:NUDIX hydrolase n=1 Tax=Sphaerobacter sp. TaxID=2099654 RepID=UPI001D3AEB2B|nr:NUDIX domain-containing protein [Sphaerobacter sp.]MBX5446384.1 NUDIX domain-containing protein [Sphaerobacter sp.]